jgi:2-methylcitrate dehydratase PrpD
MGEFVAGLTLEALPPKVVEKVRVNLLHDLSVAMAAHDVALPLWGMVAELGPEEATLLCSGDRGPAEMVAFANAVRMHARAQDDTHFSAKSHVGSMVVAATLATAQRLGSSGREVLPAIVAGYEVIGTVGELLAAQVTQRGFRASSTFGPLGVAASVAKLLKLDAISTANAIAIAMSFSGGLNQTWIDGSTEWRWEIGMAARNGVFAARLAAGGAEGASHAFEGAAGFAWAFAGVTGLSLDDLALGKRWRIMDVVYKPYPVCNITQSAVAVSSGLAKRNDLEPSQIAAVRCYLNPADRSYPGTLNEGPYADVGATLMSAHFCVAMALRERTATLKGLSKVSDPEQLALIARIDILPDEGLPVLSARVEIDTTDGRTLTDELIPDDSTYNWGWEQTMGYVDALRVEMANDGAGVTALKNALRRLETLSTVDGLVNATVAR